MSPVLGKPVNRVDGPDKVTGTGRYCGEIVLPDLAYGLIVGADVANGRVVSIDDDRGPRRPAASAAS